MAVLDKYDVWSISWLAQQWRTHRHVHGIDGFVRQGWLGEKSVTDPIRVVVPRPARSLNDMVVPVNYNI